MESDEEDASESIVQASSPESSMGDATARFPHLREPKEEETERAISPIIPLIPRTAIPGTDPPHPGHNRHQRSSGEVYLWRFIDQVKFDLDPFEMCEKALD